MCLSVDPPEVYDVAVGTGHRKPNCSLGGVSQAERGKRGPEPEGSPPGLSAIRRSS
jgi:hypothetical protein